MPDNENIRIDIIRIVPAQKWKVIRLITRVREFPSFVPTVKEATVVSRKGHTIVTRWHIKVDNVSVRWTEEDTLIASRDTVAFKAVEGDLQDFSGEWKFLDHPQGCEIRLTVLVRLNIPVIKDFASDYVRRIVTKNFESILQSAEERLVSVKYQRHKKGESGLAGFGIIGHFYNFNHLESYVRQTRQDPGAQLPSREFVTQLFHLAPSFKAYDIVNFRSKTGQTTSGCFILATFFPDMIEKDMWGVFSKVVKACRIAEKHGMGVVGLGGFTAIAGERIEHAVGEELDIPVTTGRAYTAAIVLDAVSKAADAIGLDISTATASVVGGAGAIGSACSRVLCEKVKQLTISGRTKQKLEKLTAELKKKRETRVSWTTDNREAVAEADIVIATSSAPSAILDISWFKPGAIVCDVGYPKNVSYLSAKRDDILLFDGGLASSPSPLELPINVGLTSPDLIYGCFAESIILDLEKRYESFSGEGKPILPEHIEEMRSLGEKHGFMPVPFSWQGKIISGADMELIKKNRGDQTKRCLTF